MNIRHQSNQILDQSLKSLVTEEREILSKILEHIVEIDRRKLYLDFAFSSLFDYLTRHIGYSAGSAQRRIDAARLSREIPEVVQKIENGTLSLSQVNLVQKSIRQLKSHKMDEPDFETKKTLIASLENKSFQESQILVHQTLNIAPLEAQRITHQKDESVRFEITLTKSQWQKLNKMRELLSHSLPNGSWDQVLEYVIDKIIQQKDKAKPQISRPAKPMQRSPYVPVKASRTYVPLKTRRDIFSRDRCCQYIDRTTGKQCGFRWQLSLDHLKPVWAGGSNESANLRVLCAQHNRHIYSQQSHTLRIN